MIVQRTKADARHFATAIDPAGNVSAWSPDPAKACAVDEAMASKVRAAYKDRPNAGKLDVVTGDGKPAAAPVPAPVKPADPSEIDRLTHRLAESASANDELFKKLTAANGEIGRLNAAVNERDSIIAKTAQEVTDLTAEVSLLKEENERLKKVEA